MTLVINLKIISHELKNYNARLQEFFKTAKENFIKFLAFLLRVFLQGNKKVLLAFLGYVFILCRPNVYNQ